jgi:ABC-2 type transport system ATP-binding protein
VSAVPVAISVREVRKSYGNLQAVDGVTLEVGQGEFFGILGPNGAGKTTTLEIIEGLREPDAGTVSVLGQPPWPRNPALLPRIGVQLQASAFFERLTAREQLRTFAALYQVPAAQADAMLEVVGLTDVAGTRTEKLSGGQAQRLSIACALVHGPDLLFLDEPTGSLDPQARRNLWDLLREISAAGRTVVLTTHHMDEAEALCERVAIMDHGKVLQTGPPWSAANLIILPMAFLGGAFVPLDFAPGWLRQVSYVMPLGYLVTGVQNVLARGLGPASALPAIAILLGFTAVLTVIAARFFRWEEI